MARDTKVDPAVVEAWKAARHLSRPLKRSDFPSADSVRPDSINDPYWTTFSPILLIDQSVGASKLG